MSRAPKEKEGRLNRKMKINIFQLNMKKIHGVEDGRSAYDVKDRCSS